VFEKWCDLPLTMDTKLSAVRMRVESDENEARGEGLLKWRTKMVTTNTILPYHEDDYVATFAILSQLNFYLKH